MSEVGALIIKLQTETAQFREDMGKVKKELADLGDNAQDSGDKLDKSFTEGRGGLMLVEDLVGVRLPRHLNSLITQIPGVSAAFAMMLPIAGVLVFIEIIGKVIEKHREMKEEADKLRDAEANLQGTIGTVFTNLNDKLLQAGIKADELRSDHLAALRKELTLIDHQSLKELEHSFEELAGAAEKVFAQLKAKWYQFGSGSEGAKKSLEEFESQYESLLKTSNSGNDHQAQANSLLDAKIKREERILELQKTASEYEKHSGDGGGTEEKANAYMAARTELYQSQANYSELDLKSQLELLDVLHAQADAQKTIAQTAKTDKGTTTQKEQLTVLSKEAELQKIAAQGANLHSEALRKLAQTQAETALAGNKQDPDSSIQSKLDKELSAIAQEHLAAIAAANDILASKKKVYDADIKAAGQNADKKNELDAQYVNDVQVHNDAIAQSDAAADLKSAQATQVSENLKKQIRIKAEQEAADGTLAIALDSAKKKETADMQDMHDMQTLHQMSAKAIEALEINAINDAINKEKAAYQQRIANLDTYDKESIKKKQEYETKIKEIEATGNAQIKQIQTTALMDQQRAISQAYNQMYSTVADNIAKSIVENKSLAQSFEQLGQQMAEGMIKNLLLAEMSHDKTKIINAKKAAGDSYTWASAWGGPVAGALAAATAFSAVMAFEQGGKIPGEGAVPIIGPAVKP
jgi:hypothetical protein